MCVWVVALLPQRPKLMFFEIRSCLRVPFGKPPLKKFQKTLILVFKVIVQPPKHTFEIGIFFHLLAHCDTGLIRKMEALKNSLM